MLVTFRLVVLGYLHFQKNFTFYYGGSPGGDKSWTVVMTCTVKSLVTGSRLETLILEDCIGVQFNPREWC